MRLLLAEEEEAIAHFLRTSLQGESYKVELAQEGEEACAMAASSEYDLMVLGLNLARLDGFEVLRRIRSQRAPRPSAFRCAEVETALCFSQETVFLAAPLLNVIEAVKQQHMQSCCSLAPLIARQAGNE